MTQNDIANAKAKISDAFHLVGHAYSDLSLSKILSCENHLDEAIETINSAKEIITKGGEK